MKKLAAIVVALLMCVSGTAVSAEGFSAKSNGAAIFDFEDHAFFTVKMQQNENIYLSLDTEYQKEAAQQLREKTGKEASAFYYFDTDEHSFLRTGKLFLQAQEGQTLYQLEDGEIIELDAEFEQGYIIGKDGKKISGFVLNTKLPGNYIVAE